VEDDAAYQVRARRPRQLWDPGEEQADRTGEDAQHQRRPPDHPDDPARARQPLTAQQGDDATRQREKLPRYELPVDALEGQDEHRQA
jgi:hypothetical protein